MVSSWKGRTRVLAAHAYLPHVLSGLVRFIRSVVFNHFCTIAPYL